MSRARVRLLVLALGCWLVFAPGQATGEVTAELTPRTLARDATAMLCIVVDGTTPAVIDLARLGDFTVIPRGQALGSRPSATGPHPVTAYRFELSPRRTGRLVVPSLPVTVDGETFHTPALPLLVRPPEAPPAGLAGHDVVLDVLVSTTTPYVGEQFVYTLRLFRSRAVEAVSLAPPDFSSCTAVPRPGQRDRETTVAGRTYAVSEVDYLLTPRQAGPLVLGPATANCRETVDPRSDHGSRTLIRHGPTLTITVRPLPPFSGPGTFSGLVGRNVRLRARLEPAEPGQGNAPCLVVTLTGAGNLAAVAPPVPLLPRGLTARVLPSPESEPPGPQGDATTRRFRYDLSSAPSDSLELPKIELTLFDPTRAAYVTLRTEPEAASPLTPTTAPHRPPPLSLPPDADRDASPPGMVVILLGLLTGPVLFGAIRLRQKHQERHAPLRDASPSALAEALRHALATRSSPKDEPARKALFQLDRLLYSGRPVKPETLAAAAETARRLLAGRRP